MRPEDSWWVFLLSFAISFAAAALGSLLSGEGAARWYPLLRKPRGTPPSWIYGPLWTVFYSLMALAAWLIWARLLRFDAPALRWYAAQLLLNIAWSGLFFGLREPGWALLDSVGLWLAVLITTRSFAVIEPLAGWLLVPYFLWVSYALYLNLGFWRLNRGGPRAGTAGPAARTGAGTLASAPAPLPPSPLPPSSLPPPSISAEPASPPVGPPPSEYR